VYAISNNGYRCVTPDMEILPGETVVEQLPAQLLVQIVGIEKKAERSDRLRDCDWTQMPDSPLSTAQRSSWALYRQALRDMPALPGFPDVAWPVPPELGGAAGDIKAPI
jgi:hypothetical protein